MHYLAMISLFTRLPLHIYGSLIYVLPSFYVDGNMYINLLKLRSLDILMQNSLNSSSLQLQRRKHGVQMISEYNLTRPVLIKHFVDQVSFHNTSIKGIALYGV